MQKIKVIAFVGKSGAGKDYCMRRYAAKHSCHTIVHTTTRPRRDYEKDGIDYNFITDEEFGTSTFLDTAVFNSWYYGTRYEDLDPSCDNVGVFSPAGVLQLASCTDIDLSIIYVRASDKTRLLRQLNREEEPNVKEIIRRFSADEEDFKNDKDFMTLGNSYREIWNDNRIGQ